MSRRTKSTVTSTPGAATADRRAEAEGCNLVSQERKLRLQRIKQAVTDGTYVIPAERIADSLLDDMLRTSPGPKSGGYQGKE